MIPKNNPFESTCQESKKMSGNMRDFTITPPKLKPKRGINLLLFILKPLACIVGPLTVPTIVYGVEGSTTLFWCILGIASFSSILLLTLDAQKVRDIIECLKVNRCGGIRCLIKVFLMLLVCGGGTYAYHLNLYEIFSVCLFVTGVITGTFFSDIGAWWNLRRKKNLPYVNFTKDSPKPVRPTFLDLRRKSLNVASCATNLLPLKRQLSSPTKKSSSYLNCPEFDEVKPPLPVLAETPSVSMRPIYPSSSSSSSESDGPDTPTIIPQQPTIMTPTKRRVISAGLISLSPLTKEEPISKRRLEYSGSVNPAPLQPSDDSHQQMIPTFTYTDCNVQNLMTQNFSFFHM